MSPIAEKAHYIQVAFSSSDIKVINCWTVQFDVITLTWPVVENPCGLYMRLLEGLMYCYLVELDV